MSKIYEADMNVCVTVRFTDNGKDGLEDQAHDAASSAVSIDTNEADDMGIEFAGSVKNSLRERPSQ